MSISEDLERLAQLRQSGEITEAEYEAAKALALRGESASPNSPPPPPAPPPSPSAPPAGGSDATERQTREWAMWIHLSQLAGILVPLAGLVLPIVLWQVKKDELPGVDAHGKVVVNWIITQLIVAVIGAILVFVIIGFAVLAVLAVVSIVFPILGGLRANEGKLWAYPYSFRFIK